MVETFTFITILEREGEQIFARRDDKFSFLYGCKLHLAEKVMKKLGWAWDRRVKETGCSKTVQYINKTKLPCVSGC